jgi:outer membrane receptor protein involved in Fe transport
MTVQQVGASVNVVANEEPLVDVTSNKVATNITQEKIELLPKTLRFDSVVATAPGTRNEGKAGGFQIDGASGSENTWIIDGLEVTRVFDGVLGNTKNIPFDFVREVQVKSAGYEAEFGGATGGVVNVVYSKWIQRLPRRSSVGYEYQRHRREMTDFRVGLIASASPAPVTPSAAQIAAGVKPRTFDTELLRKQRWKR